MQWYDGSHNNPVKQASNRRFDNRRFLAMGCLTPFFGLIVLTGVCAIFAALLVPTANYLGQTPQAGRTPLPALTATPLPTLTPTASAVEVAMASAPDAAPSQAQPGSDSGSAEHFAPAAGGASPATEPGGAPNSPAASGYPAGAGSGPEYPAVAPAAPRVPPPAVGQPGNEVVIILPPTVAPPATATPRPTFTPTPPAATTTPRPSLPGDNPDDDADDGDNDDTDELWTFSGVRTDTSSFQNGMVVYGNVVNHASTPQDIELVKATFYDARGNVIDQHHNVQAYWPGYTVPPDGASMPFQLLVSGLSGAANFDLSLAANSGSSSPREDFDFFDVKQMYQNGGYCLDGQLRNNGGTLQEYLVITAILYDDRNNVINFQDEQVSNPARVVGNQSYHFKLCVAPPYDGVSRYDLKAWGK